jgi:hypothetical protein
LDCIWVDNDRARDIFFKQESFKHYSGLTIILGLLNIVAFTPTIMTIGGGLRFNAMDAEVMIGIQLFSLLVFLTFIYAHRQGFMAWINKDGL